MGERVYISFDYAVKRLLRKKSDYEVLEGFLSEVLAKDISIKNLGESESNKENAEDKFNRVDILVESKSGEVMLVELQFAPEIDYLQRILYGTSKTITENMSLGSAYTEVKKVYSISVVYFDLGQGDDYVYRGKTHFKGLHTNDELHLSAAQRTAFGKELADDIYPEYYILKVNSFGGSAKDTLDEWIYFLKTNVIKDDFKARGLSKAREILVRDNLTPKERKEYDHILDIRRSNLSTIASSKAEGREEGKEEGIEIGRKKGRKEGRKEGIEIGRVEREKLAKEIEERDKRLRERDEEIENMRKNQEKLLAEMIELKRNGQK
ncbi:MAG: Rpn family recombination-promoting nuclease/putative transposase [Planctomycetaceae bacterium]|nr:Rpn family recombination-promoting nuclease/putative transposase [Planctomycetaceae bacterium]